MVAEMEIEMVGRCLKVIKLWILFEVRTKGLLNGFNKSM